MSLLPRATLHSDSEHFGLAKMSKNFLYFSIISGGLRKLVFVPKNVKYSPSEGENSFLELGHVVYISKM
jgi:hypothetical protein